ncbi:MAG: S24 family peptidase [Comamonas sp.]
MFDMDKAANQTLADNVALLIKGKAIGRLRDEMKTAGYAIGQGTLARIIAGDTGVRMESLQKFADFFGISTGTLLHEPIEDGENDFVPVARLSVQVGAGNGRPVGVVASLGLLQFRRDFLKSSGVSPINAAVVTVKGVSMEPTIRDGSILLLNKADREPRAGQIYAFSWDGEMLVKRFQAIGGVWRAVSDNADKSEYPDIIIDGKAEALIQGRAIWVGSKL